MFNEVVYTPIALIGSPEQMAYAAINGYRWANRTHAVEIIIAFSAIAIIAIVLAGLLRQTLEEPD